MKVTVNTNKTTITPESGMPRELVLGEQDIREHGFQVVDYIVEQIVPTISGGEQVTVMGDSLEAGMIARKLEDKIKRDVSLSGNLGSTLSTIGTL